MNLLIRSTDEYGEPVCLSLLNQLESKEHPVISSVIMRTPRMDISSCIMKWKEASVLLSSLVGMIYPSVRCLLDVCCESHLQPSYTKGRLSLRLYSRKCRMPQIIPSL